MRKRKLPKTAWVKGQHFSPKTEFKKGQRISVATEFKKGQIPHNKLSLGSIVARQAKNDVVRKWVKIKEPNIWIEYSKYLWLKAGRKLVKDMVLHHKNNNSTEDRLGNLILVSRVEHPKLHNRWNTKNKIYGK